MSVDMQIRPARIDDAGGIVAAIRNGFDPFLLGLFIYGCPGVEQYVREQISIRESGCDTSYTVACAGECVIGCVEMRRFPDELFLNYISILSGFRSRDLGKRLLKHSIDQSREKGHSRLSLDVLDGNVRARAWYETLGFQYRYSCAWWEVLIPESGQGAPCRVSGYPQSLASHREFGFSMFRIATEAGEYSIGRLGVDWFRIVTPDALVDPAVLPALHRLDPSRRILALLPEEGELPSSARPGRRLAMMRRMSADIEELMRRLP